ncbi:MAG: helix-turn-helix transcriptional regulator [Parachlamydiaceae bacterium]
MNHEHDCRPEQIKEIRKQLNLSQEEFAKKLGVSFTSVNRWENGQTKPSKLARRQILNLLEHIREYATSANLKG